MSQYFAIVVAAITVGFIASAITDCIKDIHRTEERILIRKESIQEASHFMEDPDGRKQIFKEAGQEAAAPADQMTFEEAPAMAPA